MRGMRVAGAQIRSAWEDPVASLEHAEPWIKSAAETGASLVCLPEQFPTGWDPSSSLHVQGREGPIVSAFRVLAREYGIAILGSFRERAHPRPRNTCIVLDRNGDEIGSYSKCHLFSPAGEGERYAPGEDPGIFSLGGVRFGLAICYDLRFPGLFDWYARQGVCSVLIPAAWPAGRISHWDLAIRARASDFQYYVVGVNTTGETPVETYEGGSLVADPGGDVVARAGRGEELMTAEIDPATIRKVRRALPVRRDRRPGLDG